LFHRKDIDRLIEEHLKAEKAGDPQGSVAMYTPDVIDDVVGSAVGPLHGPEAARGFYEMLTRDITTEKMDVVGAQLVRPESQGLQAQPIGLRRVAA
jgi:hypothetical protein